MALCRMFHQAIRKQSVPKYLRFLPQLIEQSMLTATQNILQLVLTIRRIGWFLSLLEQGYAQSA
jgi:hypothetical protein